MKRHRPNIFTLLIFILSSLNVWAQNTTKMQMPYEPHWKGGVDFINEFNVKAMNEGDRISDHFLYPQLRYEFSPRFSFGYRQEIKYNALGKEKEAEQKGTQMGDGNFVVSFSKYKFLDSKAFTPEFRLYTPISEASKEAHMITALESSSEIYWTLAPQFTLSFYFKPAVKFFKDKDFSTRLKQTVGLEYEFIKNHSFYVVTGSKTVFSSADFKEKSSDLMLNELGYYTAITKGLVLNFYVGNGVNILNPEYDVMLFADDETAYGAAAYYFF